VGDQFILAVSIGVGDRLAYASLVNQEQGAPLRQRNHKPETQIMAPSSNILIVTLGSLAQMAGGVHEYNEQDSILSRLPPDSARQLIRTRAKAFKWLKEDNTARWQGILISEHEYNKGLVRGRDFGGNDEAALYYPALRRFEGRFFLRLGIEGKQAAFLSQHHVLLLCGLYGLSALTEPVQRYNCPVETNLKNFDIWTEDNTLTDLLLDYIKEHRIARVFDFAATEPRRRLISWPAIHNELKGNVLHCFSTTAAGDDALIPFGQLMARFLLSAPTETLLAIKPETEEGGIVFRDINKPRSDMPRELELHAWNLADEIDRRRRGIIRFLDKAEGVHGSREELTGNRLTRLKERRRIEPLEASAMRVILKWRNEIIFRQHLPDSTELRDIEDKWAYLSQRVEHRRWKIDEFRNA
jgi:hypothetical protein